MHGLLLFAIIIFSFWAMCQEPVLRVPEYVALHLANRTRFTEYRSTSSYISRTAPGSPRTGPASCTDSSVEARARDTLLIRSEIERVKSSGDTLHLSALQFAEWDIKLEDMSCWTQWDIKLEDMSCWTQWDIKLEDMSCWTQ